MPNLVRGFSRTPLFLSTIVMVSNRLTVATPPHLLQIVAVGYAIESFLPQDNVADGRCYPKIHASNLGDITARVMSTRMSRSENPPFIFSLQTDYQQSTRCRCEPEQCDPSCDVCCASEVRFSKHCGTVGSACCRSEGRLKAEHPGDRRNCRSQHH